MRKKVYVLLASLLAFTLSPIAVSATSLQEHTEKIEEDLSAVTQQKIQIQEEIEATEKRMKELDKEIIQSNERIANKEKELTEIQQEVESLNGGYNRIYTLLMDREEEFKDRVSSYYRTEGNMSFLNVIFSINSFGEFIDHFVAYDKIVNKDKAFIEQYIADQNEVAAIKENVEELQKSTVEEKETLEGIKASLENKKLEKEQMAVLLAEKKKELEKQEEEKKIALELLQGLGDSVLDLMRDSGSANHEKVKSVIEPFVADAQKLHEETGVPASITLGQIILESSGRYNGLSGLAYEAKNLFGVKGTGTAGSVYFDTTEYINGEKVTVKAPFAKYETYYDSMVDHAELLLKPRYQEYLKDATSLVEYAHGIHDAGYATDPKYADKLLKIIYQYDLWRLDV